jgi:hypothetical protein
MSAEVIRAHFREQAHACGRLGSPFYERFLDACGARLGEGSEVEARVLNWPGDPSADAVALRFAGTLRFLVLAGHAPELAPLFPPAGNGDLDPAAWSLARRVLDRHEATALPLIASPPQTNEVGRSRPLLGGFLEIARRLGERLSLFEVGASGGLNLLWDDWFYRALAWRWGDPSSPLHLGVQWTGPPPPEVPVHVVARRGCDVMPLDVRRAADRLRILAYVWPDQHERLAHARCAMEHAAASPVRVEREDAAVWLARHLPLGAPSDPADAVRVVYHSIVLQDLPPARRDEVLACIRA